MIKVGDRVGFIWGRINKGTVIAPDRNIGSGIIVKFDERFSEGLNANNSYSFHEYQLIKLTEGKRIFSDLDPFGEEDWEE